MLIGFLMATETNLLDLVLKKNIQTKEESKIIIFTT